MRVAVMALVMTVFGLASLGGCGLMKTGTSDGLENGPSSCDNAVHCYDGSLCTVDACGADGLCINMPLDGDPPSQPLGDCERVTCQAGKMVKAPDDRDVDDGNRCTDDFCQAGEPKHTNIDGKPCALGEATGVCRAGECVVPCGSDSAGCDDGNPCTEDACDLQASACVHDATKLHGTLVSDTSSIDCGELRCMNGELAQVPDDSEVPDDASDCTVDECQGGEQTHDNLPLNTACGVKGNLYCNGKGKCVTCNDAAQCMAPECKEPTCAASVCGTSNSPAGKPCSKGVCKGNGACVECVVDADCSELESEVCASDTCVTSCGDAKENGLETDVDCGGGVCGPCVPGKKCDAGSDCQSGVCTGGVCAGPTCGDGVVNGSEECDDGNADNTDACPTTCKIAKCGDGFVRVGTEACDDGNGSAGDGCGACAVEPGYTCTGVMPSVCMTTCGDGTKAGTEACDDGDTDSDDGCSAMCAVEFGYACTGVMPSVCVTTCGDGIKAAAEGCDDSNTVSGDGCSATCAVELGYACPGTMPSVCVTTCGDGIKAAIEGCDDGDTDSGDGCSATCAVESGYACSGTAPSVCATTCGDGTKAGTEACDDGNMAIGDGCSATCAVEPGYTCSGMPSVCSTTCGDGTAGGVETCDDGNAVSGDGCSATCAVEPGYTCAGAPSACEATCGDGLVVGAEACDDGNTDDGDGCNAACLEEPGYTCTGTAPSVCVADATCGDGNVTGMETCDDGNTVNGDGCSGACDVECAPGDMFLAYASSDVPQTIAGSSTVGSTLDVADMGTVQKVIVTLSITHGEVADLSISLTSPLGTTVDLSSDNGGTGANYEGTIFYDACLPVTSGTAPFSACFSPEDALADVNGEGGMGIWTLGVENASSQSTGTLTTWSLSVCVTPPP